MTEEDTFNKLKRLPLSQIVDIMYHKDLTSMGIRAWVEKRDQLLEENGYILTEYFDILNDRRRYIQ